MFLFLLCCYSCGCHRRVFCYCYVIALLPPIPTVVFIDCLWEDLATAFLFWDVPQPQHDVAWKKLGSAWVSFPLIQGFEALCQELRNSLRLLSDCGKGVSKVTKVTKADDDLMNIFEEITKARLRTNDH